MVAAAFLSVQLAESLCQFFNQLDLSREDSIHCLGNKPALLPCSSHERVAEIDLGLSGCP